MAVDPANFPEMSTFSSVIRYALTFEQSAEEFYQGAAELTGDKAQLFAALAKAHQARGRLLEETRQQKLNEMILEPVSGLDREAYLPDTEPCDAEEEWVQKAVSLEELGARLYRDISQSAVELSREASRIYQRMASENDKQRNRLAEA